MSSFNEGFYTEGLDQEMLDFIEENYTLDKDVGWDDLDLKLCYSKVCDDFYLLPQSYTLHLPYLTKEQFKEKIGMLTDDTIMESKSIQEQATFGKKDLVDGMFVKCRNEDIHIVIGTCAHDNKGWMDLENEFTEDLLENSDITDLDIVEVFIKEKNLSLVEHFVGAGLKSIWKRTPPKSEKVIKLEKLILVHEEQLEATNKRKRNGILDFLCCI